MKKTLLTPTQQTILEQEEALEKIFDYLPYFHTNAVLVDNDVTEQDFIVWKELREVDLNTLSEIQLLRLISLCNHYLKYSQDEYFDFVGSQTNREWNSLYRKILWILAFFDPINKSTNVLIWNDRGISKPYRVETLESNKSENITKKAFLKYIRNPLFRKMFLRSQKKLIDLYKYKRDQRLKKEKIEREDQ